MTLTKFHQLIWEQFTTQVIPESDKGYSKTTESCIELFLQIGMELNHVRLPIHFGAKHPLGWTVSFEGKSLTATLTCIPSMRFNLVQFTPNNGETSFFYSIKTEDLLDYIGILDEQTLLLAITKDQEKA